MSEIYSLATSFPAGLNNQQLKTLIDESTIVKNCIYINTEDDIVDIRFNLELSAEERTELNNIIASYNYSNDEQTLTIENIKFVNPKVRTAIYTISNKAISANTDTPLDGWTTEQTSKKIEFDAVNGLFIADDGYYSMSIRQAVITNDVFNELGLRLVDNLGDTIYSNVQRSANLYQPDTGFYGIQCENCTGQFNTGKTYKLHSKIDTAQTMDYRLIITRLF